MSQCDRIAGTRYRIDGVLGDYLASVSEQWLKVARAPIRRCWRCSATATAGRCARW